MSDLTHSLTLIPADPGRPILTVTPNKYAFDGGLLICDTWDDATSTLNRDVYPLATYAHVAINTVVARRGRDRS